MTELNDPIKEAIENIEEKPEETVEEPGQPGEASTEKPADPPEVKEKTEKFYQSKYQEQLDKTKAIESELAKKNEQLEKYKNYELPEVDEPTSKKLEDEYEDPDDRIADKVLARLEAKERAKAQKEINRVYNQELKDVGDVFQNFIEKHDIPKSIYEKALQKANSLIPMVNGSDVVGAPSRRLEIVQMYCKDYIVEKSEKAFKDLKIAQDREKTEALGRIETPAGSASLPAMNEKTPAEKEADLIAPDDEPIS